MEQLLHTPEGVRDIYHEECAKKLALQNRLHKTLHLYGYHDIQTPTIEYFDVFREEIGTTPANDLYKFFDKDGNTLVLRPDITPSIARASATLFKDENLPIRLCYTGNTFVNHSSYQGRLRETTQMGAEFVGDDSVEADAEMLALVIESMLTIGLKEFQLCVGNVDFFQSLIEDASLDEEAEERVRELIGNRNYFGVEEFLDSIQAKRSSKEAFSALNELIGGIDILEKAENLAPNSKGVMAIRRLEKIYHILRYYGVEKFVTFDLSMTGTYGYYTGIVFRGYTYGTGDAVVKGGRYDHLIGQFGKDAASVGFAVVLDELMLALSRQKIAVLVEEGPTLVLYDSFVRDQAIEASIQIRRDGGKAALMRRIEGYPLSFYSAYAKRNALEKVVYFAADGNVRTVKPQEEKA